MQAGPLRALLISSTPPPAAASPTPPSPAEQEAAVASAARALRLLLALAAPRPQHEEHKQGEEEEEEPVDAGTPWVEGLLQARTRLQLAGRRRPSSSSSPRSTGGGGEGGDNVNALLLTRSAQTGAVLRALRLALDAEAPPGASGTGGQQELGGAAMVLCAELPARAAWGGEEAGWWGGLLGRLPACVREVRVRVGGVGDGGSGAAAALEGMVRRAPAGRALRVVVLDPWRRVGAEARRALAQVAFGSGGDVRLVFAP